ncbi:hypothetical protein L1987_13459 [Smallanthus sonchifolius]|uniref:Uncharacterized protein n=1 Tax=Smallanthus sonchifolius TaxID=185202 RepID=A0ACB9JIY2_9ASTR|nr:hypothetical protein L1987_13459 [Smallanthus sonchifolius]
MNQRKGCERDQLRSGKSARWRRHLGVRMTSGGPRVGCDYGPYRDSERNDLYKQYAEKLIQSGQVYRHFCSNDVCVIELERDGCMRDAIVELLIFIHV